MRLHHIGIATNDLETLIGEYLSRGYKLMNDTYDSTQKAKLCLLSKDGEDNIELIFTDDMTSRVFNLSQNNYKKEYHKCYQVGNIRDSVNKFKKNGFIQVSNVEKAVLLDARVCFMYKDGELIELMEEI